MNSATDNIFGLNTKNPSALVSIIDESLELRRSIRNDLVCSISSTEFSLAVLDRKQNKFLALEIFQNEKTTDVQKQADWVKETAAKSLILKNNIFKSTSIAFSNELTTLVPSALFNEADAAKYFHFNFNAEDEIIHSENIRAFDVVNIFAVPKTLSETVSRLFEQPAIHHSTTALLEGVHLSFKKSGEKIMLLNFRNGYLDILVTEGKKLIFLNSFSYRNSEDMAYYVMFVCDRLQLNPETVSAYTMGEIERESALYNILYKYIRNIHFALRPDVLDFSDVFREIPPHFYFNLFSLALCES